MRVWEELGVGRGEPEGEWLEGTMGADAGSVDIGGKDGEKTELGLFGGERWTFL
jgi:hypothetical protein